MASEEVKNSSSRDLDADQMPRIFSLIRDIQFGQLTITIQNGRIVQIEKTEKYRLNEL